MTQPTYLILAGTSGAGKSTFTATQPELFTARRRIDANDILQADHGNWQSARDHRAAIRQAIHQVKDALAKRETFYVETVLASDDHTQLALIADARRLGYRVELIYISIQSPELATQRIAARQAQGGPGQPPDVTADRYGQSSAYFAKVAALCDDLTIYDNTTEFRRVYRAVAGQVVNNRLAEFPWLWSLIGVAPLR